MILALLNKNFNWLIGRIQLLSNRKNWKIELTFITFLTAFFFSFPSYEWISNKEMTNWEALLNQANHPFTNNNYNPASHQAKMAFRLFGPIIIRVFHLNIFGITIFLFFFGIATIYLFIKSLLKITNNKTITVLLTFAFAGTAICKNPFNDILGFLDGFAIFFLIIPIAFNNPFITFLAVFLAGWVDERALIATDFIFLWTLFCYNDKIKWVRLFAIISGWITYFCLRFYLAYHFNLITLTDAVGYEILRNQVNNIPIGIWTGLEGFWILIVLSILILWVQKRRIFAILFSFCILLSTLVAFSVNDITRSLIYLFPSIFISLHIIRDVESDINLTKISLVVLLLCMLFPQLVVGGYSTVIWQYPLPLQILRYLTGK